MCELVELFTGVRMVYFHERHRQAIIYGVYLVNASTPFS